MLGWFQAGSNLVQVWFSSGSGTVRLWFGSVGGLVLDVRPSGLASASTGPALADCWHPRCAVGALVRLLARSGMVQNWFSPGSGWIRNDSSLVREWCGNGSKLAAIWPHGGSHMAPHAPAASIDGAQPRRRRGLFGEGVVVTKQSPAVALLHFLLAAGRPRL